MAEILDGLSAQDRAATAAALRELRVLHADRDMADTIQQEAIFTREELPKLRELDPVGAGEIALAMRDTQQARDAIADQYGIVAKVVGTWTPTAAGQGTERFLDAMRKAERGDATAMAHIEKAREALLEAETETGGISPGFDASKPMAGLPALELAARMTDHRVEMLAPIAKQDPEAYQAAKAARKLAEFEAMRSTQQHEQDRREDEAEERHDAAKERQQAGNEVEAEGLVGSNKLRPPNALPDHFADRYEKHGKSLHRIGDPKQVLLVDHGKKLTADKEFDSEAIKAMVDIAEARGWSSLTVKGTPEFRRAVWTEAANRGLGVQGYKPTDAEQQRMDRALEKNGKQNALSENEAVRAFKDAKTKEDRSAAAKKHPELKAAFGVEAAMTAFSRERLQGSGREAFMQRMRNNIAFDLAQGREIATVALVYPASRQRPPQPAQDTQPQRDAGRER